MSDAAPTTPETSDIASLLSQTSRTPFDIVRVAQTELVVSDLAASRAYYVDALGLVVAAETETTLLLRGWEERIHHSLTLRVGETPGLAHVGFRVREAEDLARLEQWFAGQGLPTAWAPAHAHRGPMLLARDHIGYPLAFFHEVELVPTKLQAFHEHRGAPILRLDHVNFHVPDVARAAAFWLSMGFRCSEYISTDSEPETLTGCWLLRAPSVHDVALTVGTGPRLHHMAFWVGEPAGILRTCDQLAAAGHTVSIERGPGRHGVSNAFFVYVRDPDGHRIELYSCDYWTGDPDHVPLRWSVNDPRCRSFWGTRAPDSWYDESSLVLDADGRPIEIETTEVDERSELMA